MTVAATGELPQYCLGDRAPAGCSLAAAARCGKDQAMVTHRDMGCVGSTSTRFVHRARLLSTACGRVHRGTRLAAERQADGQSLSRPPRRRPACRRKTAHEPNPSTAGLRARCGCHGVSAQHRDRVEREGPPGLAMCIGTGSAERPSSVLAAAHVLTDWLLTQRPEPLHPSRTWTSGCPPDEVHQFPASRSRSASGAVLLGFVIVVWSRSTAESSTRATRRSCEA